MRTRTQLFPASCRLLLIVVAFLVLSPLDVAWAADGQKKVLVLYSTRREAQVSIVGDRELPRILDGGLIEGLDFYSEYVDQSRFPDPEHREAFRDFLRLKYGGQRFDLVIAIQDVAIQFFETVRTRVVSRHADGLLHGFWRRSPHSELNRVGHRVGLSKHAHLR